METDQERYAGAEADVRHRDAGDGRFVTEADAEQRPGETILETVDHPTPREVASARLLLGAALARDTRDGERQHRTHAEAHAATVDRVHDLRAGIVAALALLEP